MISHIYCSRLQCHRLQFVFQETYQNFTEKFQRWYNSNVYRCGGSKLDYVFCMSIDFPSCAPSKVILGQSGHHRTSLSCQNHTSGANYRHPHNCLSLLSPQTHICHSTLKIKNAAHLHELKIHWGQNLGESVNCAIGDCIYRASGSAHHKLLCLGQFHNSNHRQMNLNGKSNTNQYVAWKDLKQSHVKKWIMWSLAIARQKCIMWSTEIVRICAHFVPLKIWFKMNAQSILYPIWLQMLYNGTSAHLFLSS